MSLFTSNGVVRGNDMDTSFTVYSIEYVYYYVTNNLSCIFHFTRQQVWNTESSESINNQLVR
jgi:hypothetical protein